tara:strand:- start:538 stop:648 length:111 start_codon:yes stop_codon:yes gene_type:complete
MAYPKRTSEMVLREAKKGKNTGNKFWVILTSLNAEK